MDTCHCGALMRGSDHCPECLCEVFESTCERRIWKVTHTVETHVFANSEQEAIECVAFEQETDGIVDVRLISSHAVITDRTENDI